MAPGHSPATTTSEEGAGDAAFAGKDETGGCGGRCGAPAAGRKGCPLGGLATGTLARDWDLGGEAVAGAPAWDRCLGGGDAAEALPASKGLACRARGVCGADEITRRGEARPAGRFVGGAPVVSITLQPRRRATVAAAATNARARGAAVMQMLGREDSGQTWRRSLSFWSRRHGGGSSAKGKCRREQWQAGSSRCSGLLCPPVGSGLVLHRCTKHSQARRNSTHAAWTAPCTICCDVQRAAH